MNKEQCDFFIEDSEKFGDSGRRAFYRMKHDETAWATDLPKPTAEDIAASNEFARRLQKAMEAQKNHGWFYYSPVSMVTG